MNHDTTRIQWAFLIERSFTRQSMIFPVNACRTHLASDDSYTTSLLHVEGCFFTCREQYIRMGENHNASIQTIALHIFFV